MLLRIVMLAIVFFGTINCALAHTLWVNTFESRAHKPAHVLCSIGWGHNPPLDDLPQQVALASYNLYGPDLRQTPLPTPTATSSNVRQGDLVKFKILFKGKELNTSPEVSIEYITAVSDSFGGPDKFTLSCPIFGGNGQFRIPAPGQWLVNVYTRQEVTDDNELKNLANKCDTALFSSSITFKVNP